MSSDMSDSSSAEEKKLRVCRMCASVITTEYISLLGNYPERRPLNVVLENFTGVQVHQNSEASTIICYKCLGQLESAEKMRRTTLEAQNKLQNANIIPKASRELSNSSSSSEGEGQLKLNGYRVSNTISTKDSRATNAKKITCRLCQQVFTILTYESHVCYMADAHCPQCTSVYTCKCRKKKPSKKSIKCDHCGKICDTPQILESHLKDVARSRIFFCYHCTCFYETDDDLMTHVLQEHSNVTNMECD